MIEITEKFYSKNNKVDFVSKKDQIELVATMIKNNLKSYSTIHRFKTDINPKLDMFKTYKEIEKDISSLDYANKLYFYSAGLLELVMFDHHLLERNVEIKEATRNAQVLREIFNKNTSNKLLCANNYIDISDIRNVVLNVFCDLNCSTIVEDDRLKEVITSYQSDFEKYFKGVLSPIEVFSNIMYLCATSISDVEYSHGIDKLNMSIKNSGGIMKGVNLDKEQIDEMLTSLSKIIPMSEMKHHVEVLKDNNELINLGFNELTSEYTCKQKLEILDLYLLTGEPVRDIFEI